jgi:hypothetical protein
VQKKLIDFTEIFLKKTRKMTKSKIRMKCDVPPNALKRLPINKFCFCVQIVDVYFLLIVVSALIFQTQKLHSENDEIRKKYDEQKKLNGSVLKLLAAKDMKIECLEKQIQDLTKTSIDDIHEKYKNTFSRAQIAELNRIPASARNDFTYIKTLLQMMISNGNSSILGSTVKKINSETYEIIQDLFESRVKGAASCDFDLASRYNEKVIRKHISTALSTLRSLARKENATNSASYEIFEDADQIVVFEK